MREILKTIVYIFFPPYVVVYLLRLFEVITLRTEVSVFLALFMNIMNLFFALLFYNSSKNKSNEVFFIFNFGGMGVRLFFLLITFTLSLIFLEIDKYAFILVFLIFYIIGLVYEIKHFNGTKEWKNK